MVRLAGIEPTTPRFVAKYSIQLSYSREVWNCSTGPLGKGPKRIPQREATPVSRGLSAIIPNMGTKSPDFLGLANFQEISTLKSRGIYVYCYI